MILLATAVLVMVIFRILRLPALPGYLLVDIVISPPARGLVPDEDLEAADMYLMPG